MKRIDYLRNHLESLIALNNNGIDDYSGEIRTTLNEIEKELGIKGTFSLASYPTHELHEELARREGVQEIVIAVEAEAVIHTVIGEVDKNYSVKGPAKILVNQD